MDTSGLGSSLSLSAFLLAFAYLSLVEYARPKGSLPARSPDHHKPHLFWTRALRAVCLVAATLSAQALLESQESPGVGLMAAVALALLATLGAVDGLARLTASRFPAITTRVSSPIQAPLLRLFQPPRTNGRHRAEPDATGNDSENGAAAELDGEHIVVITEEEQAGLDARERLMIRSILRLDESTAREVMVPRVDIVAVEDNTALTEVAHRMLEAGHSRLPVFHETIDNVSGVVYSRDLLPLLGKPLEYPSLESVLRPAFFIPESKRLDDLLRELQEKRIQMAIVVDEYGGVEGLVTLEDLLEEIVGEIEDEFSHRLEPRVIPLANGDTIVDSAVSLDYLSDLFGTPIEVEGVDTVGGLVYSTLGKMPQVGDQVDHNGLRIEVLSLLGRRLRKLKLQRYQAPTSA